MNKEELLNKIKELAPWYQRITFPEYGVSTTDDLGNAVLDEAWDNAIGHNDLVRAARQRPVPKYEAIRSWLPDVSGKQVLEIGSNCGFFSFEFARLGAEHVTGIDVSQYSYVRANWCKDVLGLQNVSFFQTDFSVFDPAQPTPNRGLMNYEDPAIPLPQNCYDVIFMSTVLDHMFFPFLTMYKMIKMARENVIVDVPVLHWLDTSKPILHLGVPEDNSHHGFVGTEIFFKKYIQRLGVDSKDIIIHRYNDGKSMMIDISTRNKQTVLCGC